MQRRLFIIAAIILSLSCSSQGWRSRITLPGSLDHITKAVFPYGGNKYLVTGYSLELVKGQQVSRLVTLGLDSLGKLEWVKKYGDTSLFYYSNPFISRAFHRKENHVYYAGCARDSSNKQIGVLTKISFSGDTVWQKLYRSADPDEDVIPQMLTSSVDGGFLITGFFQHWSQHYRRCLLIKTDAQGNELWRRSISKTAPDVQDGKAIVQDSASKKIIIAGYQYVGYVDNGPVVVDNILILDSLGYKLNHIGHVSGYAMDLIQTRDKSLVSAGERIRADVLKDRQSYVCKFDLHDPQLPSWKSIFSNDEYNNMFSSIREMVNGDLLIAQMRDSIQRYTANNQIGFVKTDDAGIEIWSREYYYNCATTWFTFELTPDGGWVAAFPLVRKKDDGFLIVKYDSSGCDSSLAYCSLISGLPEDLRQNLSVYPVPCDEILRITNTTGNMSARLYNLKGVLQKEIRFETMQQEAEINTTSLTPGVYLLQLQSGAAVLNRKVIVEH